MSSPRGLRLLTVGAGSTRDVLAATAIAGGAGYAITFAAGAVLGSKDYLPFAAFWSALYLIVGALAGVQHETTRASRPATPPTHPGTAARNVFVAVGAATTVLLLATSPLWVHRVFDAHGGALLAPLVVGALGYLAMCVAGGVLAGLASWRLIAVITAADALLRLALVGTALLVTRDVVVLAWCVAVPFGVVGMVGGWLVTARVRGSYTIDAPLGQLAWNATRTVASGAAMGVLITGFPALLSATASNADTESNAVSSIMFVSNLVRSPLIVLTMAFQVMMVQRLRDAVRPDAAVAKLLAALFAVGAVLTAVVAAAGPSLLEAAFDGEYMLTTSQLVILVGSAAPSAAMFVTGAALLARGQHGTYVTGWALAAAVAVGALAWGPSLMVAVTGAVLVGPALGLCLHLVALARRSRRSAELITETS